MSFNATPTQTTKAEQSPGTNTAAESVFWDACKKAFSMLNGRVVTPVTADLSQNVGKCLLLTGGIIAVYAIFRHLANKGESSPQKLHQVKLLTYVYNDGRKIFAIKADDRPMTIEGEQLERLQQDGLKEIEICKVNHTAYLLSTIDKLKTREEIVSWLIAYQNLEGKGNGIDTTWGTVGCGLASVLRGAIAGENKGWLDDAATKAIVDTLKELREDEDLGLLNKITYEDNLEFQEIELKHHRANMQNYDQFGKTIFNLSAETRARMCYAASRVQGIPKAMVGMSRQNPPAASDPVATAYSIAKIMKKLPQQYRGLELLTAPSDSRRRLINNGRLVYNGMSRQNPLSTTTDPVAIINTTDSDNKS